MMSSKPIWYSIYRAEGNRKKRTSFAEIVTDKKWLQKVVLVYEKEVFWLDVDEKRLLMSIQGHEIKLDSIKEASVALYRRYQVKIPLTTRKLGLCSTSLE